MAMKVQMKMREIGPLCEYCLDLASIVRLLPTIPPPPCPTNALSNERFLP